MIDKMMTSKKIYISNFHFLQIFNKTFMKYYFYFKKKVLWKKMKEEQYIFF